MERKIDNLRRWCIRRRLDGWPVKDICTHARIHRQTFYFWWRKYKSGGLDTLDPASRRPKTIHRTSPDIVKRVIELRKKTGWNEKAIAKRVGVGHTTVYRILKANGMIKALNKPRQQRTYRSFSRKHTDSLWQTDIKYHEGSYLIAYIDDCSRYVLDAVLMEKATT